MKLWIDQSYIAESPILWFMPKISCPFTCLNFCSEVPVYSVAKCIWYICLKLNEQLKQRFKRSYYAGGYSPRYC